MDVLTVDFQSPNAAILFSQSLKETGFAVLTNHPISPNLIEQAYQSWVNFFNSDHKKDYTYQKPKQDGYFPFGTENAKNSSVSDLKEFYHFYLNGKQPPETQEITLALFSELIYMASILLKWVESHLPTTIATDLSMPLHQMITNSENILLRILHYPPLHHAIQAGAVRAAAHEDINLLTLLPAATAPGLEVLDAEGRWHAVSCDKGNVVVNVGDMLQKSTQGYYKSTTHRVVNPIHANENVSRYSMPLFLHARPEVLIAPNLTAQTYLHERLRQIGIY